MDHTKSAAKVTSNSFKSIDNVYKAWTEDEKVKLLKAIEEYGSKPITVDLWTKFQAYTSSWQQVYILDNAKFNETLSKIKKNEMSNLFDADIGGRSIDKTFGKLNKVSDLKAVVNRFDGNMKKLADACRASGNSPKTIQALLANAIHGFFATTNRIINGSK